MTVTIRKATAADPPALGQLGAALMQQHYEFDRLRFLTPRAGASVGYAGFLGSMLDDPDSVIFVADDGSGVVGYVFAALEPLSWKELRGPAGFIHDVLVAEGSCGHGIGTKLMAAAIDWLRERGAPRVVLWTAAQNGGAHALFARLGFRDTMVEMTLELTR